MDVFEPTRFNMCFESSGEQFGRDGSFEYPQHESGLLTICFGLEIVLLVDHLICSVMRILKTF